jgi:hypothetical protein
MVWSPHPVFHETTFALFCFFLLTHLFEYTLEPPTISTQSISLWGVLTTDTHIYWKEAPLLLSPPIPSKV